MSGDGAARHPHPEAFHFLTVKILSCAQGSLRVGFVLGENAAAVDHGGLGAAVLLFVGNPSSSSLRMDSPVASPLTDMMGACGPGELASRSCQFWAAAPAAVSGGPRFGCRRPRAVGACAGEAGVNVGGSPTRRIRLFAAENNVRAAAARPGRKQGIDWTGRP
jgi:hypothetical protein